MRDVYPKLRFAHLPGSPSENVLRGLRGVPQLPPGSAPSILVSYAFIGNGDGFLETQGEHVYRDWALDSGAYSVAYGGATVDLVEYTETALRLQEEDPTLDEVFALDVVGDPDASLRNTRYMWEQGVRATPAYHRGSPWSVLEELAAEFPKVAIGGVARMNIHARVEWVGQCFARIWPKKVHGFAIADRRCLLTYPFHTVDATSWQFRPLRYGQWRAYGRQRVSIRGSAQNLRAEVESYLALEREMQGRWSREMARLDGAAA